MPPNRGRKALCHPDQKHAARDMCARCYSNYRTTQRKHQLRDYWLQRNYGLTYVAYKNLEATQHGLCALCGNPPRGTRLLSVDHNHTTGKVRALLCTYCNYLVGTVENKADQIAAAMLYLKNHAAG